MQSFLQEIKLLPEEPHETLITLCVREKTVADFVYFLEDQLQKMKKISHAGRKKILNDRLYGLLCRYKDLDESLPVHKIFFIGDEIHDLDLSPHHIKTANEFGLHNPYYKCDTSFPCAFFQDFFCRQEFYALVSVEKKTRVTLKFYSLSKEKTLSRTIKEEKDLDKELDSALTSCGSIKVVDTFVYSNPQVQTRYKKAEKIYSRDEFMSFLETTRAQENHRLLEKRLGEIKNEKTNLDLFVFGKLKKEILDAVENYQLKELYIDAKKLEKLETFCAPECLNFTIIPIVSLEPGDTGDCFLKDYNGLMGIRYY